MTRKVDDVFVSHRGCYAAAAEAGTTCLQQEEQQTKYVPWGLELHRPLEAVQHDAPEFKSLNVTERPLVLIKRSQEDVVGTLDWCWNYGTRPDCATATSRGQAGISPTACDLGDAYNHTLQVTCHAHTLWQITFNASRHKHWKRNGLDDRGNARWTNTDTDVLYGTSELPPATLGGATQHASASCCVSCCHSKSVYDKYCKYAGKYQTGGVGAGRGDFETCCPHELRGAASVDATGASAQFDFTGCSQPGPLQAAAKPATPGPAPQAWEGLSSGARSDPWRNATLDGNAAAQADWQNVLRQTADWWDGTLAQRYKRDAPKGHQLADFTDAVLKYQVFCVQQGLPMRLLYDEHEPRRGRNAPPRPFSDATVQRWVGDLFDEWLRGDLALPLEQRRRADGSRVTQVPPAAREYGGSAALCARLPSVVNYVSNCDCKLEPQCNSTTEHRLLYFFGSRSIIAQFGIRSPAPTSCSYFRQLELLQDTGGVKGYDPLIDIVRNATPHRRAGVTLSYEYRLSDFFGHQNRSNNETLRDLMEKAFVDRWESSIHYKDTTAGLTEQPRVWTRYYSECNPTQCFYEKAQEVNVLNRLLYLLSLIGGLVAIMAPGAQGVVNVLDAVFYKPSAEGVVEAERNEAAMEVTHGGMSFELKVRNTGRAIMAGLNRQFSAAVLPVGPDTPTPAGRTRMGLRGFNFGSSRKVVPAASQNPTAQATRL